MSFDPPDPHRHALGLILPASADPVREAAAPANVGTYLTYAELTQRPSLTESEIVALLETMSAADCLLSLAQLSAQLFARGSRADSGDAQHQLVDAVVGTGQLARALHEKLNDPEWSAVFCEQQLVHLARLVILHADRRAPDEFASRELYANWVTCLIAVNDLLDAGLDIEDREARLAWEIRQSQLNHHDDLLCAMAVHYEVYAVLWPELLGDGAAAAERAFRSATGTSIGDYFTVGSAVMARLVKFGNSSDGAPMVQPEVYFSKTKLDPSVPGAFFACVARDVDGLRAELQREEAAYGPTTYGSLTFERFPLVEAQPGFFLPISVASLQRRITEGVFHVLSEAAEREGLDRRHYASSFGNVFQVLVERTARRGEARLASPAPITADVAYGGRSHRRDSSDVIIATERNPVFIEVVSGPLQAATTTRGDVTAFRTDMRRLIVSKAKQLDRCIADFLVGRLELDGANRSTTYRVWPVIVTSHSFPHADTVLQTIRGALRDAGHLQQDKAGGLAIVSAEDLVFCEGHMEQGRTFLSLIRSWKSGPRADLPFKHELVALGGGRAPGSTHFTRRFAEANADWVNKLLGEAVTPEQFLDRGQRGERG